MTHFPLLTVILFLPMVVSFALLFIPRLSDAAVKYAALATVLVELVLSLVVVFSARQETALQWQ